MTALTTAGPARARIVLAALGAIALVLGATAAPAEAKPTHKQKPVTLAHLNIIKPAVTIKAAGAKKAVKGKTGQVLRQGDSLTTDTTGIAEIDYTDGSLTRLSPSTTFKITELTNKKGGRQTQGSLSVGDTWNRAAKVSETGSFEVKAGGTTAAVEGTAFLFTCHPQNGVRVCNVIAVVDDVKVSSPATTTTLNPDDGVGVNNDVQGSVHQYSYDELIANPLIVSNLTLDQQEGRGSLSELPTTTTTTTTQPPAPAPRRVAPAPTAPPATTAPPTTTAPPPPPTTKCNSNLC